MNAFALFGATLGNVCCTIARAPVLLELGFFATLEPQDRTGFLLHTVQHGSASVRLLSVDSKEVIGLKNLRFKRMSTRCSGVLHREPSSDVDVTGGGGALGVGGHAQSAKFGL
ncbi:MAG: hypothetical protein Q8N44_02785 [Rubrivivax sp.]|nr:hypothetical protein [Rubrivivax sp.]MDP3082607.1 hypothetical protein [Rubrivivax sp.]